MLSGGYNDGFPMLNYIIFHNICNGIYFYICEKFSVNCNSIIVCDQYCIFNGFNQRYVLIKKIRTNYYVYHNSNTGIECSIINISSIYIQKSPCKIQQKKEEIKLSSNSKKQMSVYFTMFIATIAFTWFLAMFYFGEADYDNFFDYNFVGKPLPPKLLMLIFILKISTCIAGLGLSAYMVFLSDRFSKLRRSQYV